MSESGVTQNSLLKTHYSKPSRAKSHLLIRSHDVPPAIFAIFFTFQYVNWVKRGAILCEQEWLPMSANSKVTDLCRS
jgi:hypothetical protein